MDRTSKNSFWFRNLRVSSLLCTEDVVLLVSPGQDLQRAPRLFTAGRVRSSKSEDTVLNPKRVRQFLSQVKELKEFKYLEVLLLNDGEMEEGTSRQIRASSAVIRMLLRSIVIKEELSSSTKLWIYWPMHGPTLTSVHEVQMRRTRCWIKAAETRWTDCWMCGWMLS